jgi:hypothetical protein
MTGTGFEEVDVEEHAFDAVTAYHWISPKTQVGRPASALKPEALLAAVLPPPNWEVVVRAAV